MRQKILFAYLEYAKILIIESIPKGEQGHPLSLTVSLPRASCVEMLENQQAQLVTGFQELYKRTQRGQGWIGRPLKETSRGRLSHTIY